uniref:Dolichyl-diphosphooligosaccharide--protein glycosyltransferase subunit DAD1 n=1 Tax=Botryococcus braunii TaxID=38881 RepID=A0A1D8GSZ5_BOTBR|nr:defender against cell death 1 [Botryococcus braunii]|eukprot:jgi/Botrbrau1/2693/Bobra.0203s0036.1
MDTLKLIATSFQSEYKKTPVHLKVLDCFLVYGVVTAAIQFLYMMLVGSFPFNSFLSGVFSSVGFFVLTVVLRMQANPANKDFKNLSPERAFADYVLCSCLLFYVAWNFMG